MAERVDSMSDAELRTKLAEHGFPVMPITASTRKLLVKKLKLVLDNKTKPRNSVDSKADDRRTLSRYSSGEESDLDATSDVKEKKSRRATTGAMPPPASARTRRGTPKKETVKVVEEAGSESEEERSPVRTCEEVETVTTRRITRTFAQPDGDDCETGSDSDVDAERKTAPPNRSSSRSSDYISSTLPMHDVSTSPPKPSILSRPSLSSSYSSSDHLNSIRSRLGLTSNLSDRPSAASTYASNFANTFRPSTIGSDEVESPYLSEFTRRLTSLKPESAKPASTYLDRDNNNGAHLLPRRSYISSVSRSSAVDYKNVNDRNFLKNNIVSLALVGIVVIFFFCLFSIYMVKKNDITSIVDDPNSVIPLCQLRNPNSKPGINCVHENQVSEAKDLLKALHPELAVRAAAYKCGKLGAVPYLLESEIMDLANTRVNIQVSPTEHRTNLHNLQVLLVSNPNWGVSVVQPKNPYSKDVEYSPLTTTDLMVRQRSNGKVALALSDPSTPVSCFVANALYSAGSTAVWIGVLTLAVLGAHRGWMYYRAHQKRKNDEIYSMVEQIIDAIAQETEGSGEAYVPVDHIRDALLPVATRARLVAVWDAAVRYIQQHDSRVRLEVQAVGGEDCRVWRWLPAAGSAGSSPTRNTAWQGQAFETQEGSANGPAVSPTPCLKVRHMFEAGAWSEALRARLTDAVLDKVGPACRVLHVAVEPASCCVYLRCAGARDAGLAYRALHGWWFSGRLVTAKFLRLERYLQRFPDAPHSPPYLQPSAAFSAAATTAPGTSQHD